MHKYLQHGSQAQGDGQAASSTAGDAYLTPHTLHLTPGFLRPAAFTLIELMIVVIIIGVLVATVLPRLAGRSEEARAAAAASGLASIGTAAELFQLDMRRYPERLEELTRRPIDAERWKGPYLQRAPVDPWGRMYRYRYPGERGLEFDLSSDGADGIEGSGDDVANWAALEETGGTRQ